MRKVKITKEEKEEERSFSVPKLYVLDIEKIKTIEDVKEVFKLLNVIITVCESDKTYNEAIKKGIIKLKNK
jgi:hypothetical protein